MRHLYLAGLPLHNRITLKPLIYKLCEKTGKTFDEVAIILIKAMI